MLVHCFIRPGYWNQDWCLCLSSASIGSFSFACHLLRGHKTTIDKSVLRVACTHIRIFIWRAFYWRQTTDSTHTPTYPSPHTNTHIYNSNTYFI